MKSRVKVESRKPKVEWSERRGRHRRQAARAAVSEAAVERIKVRRLVVWVLFFSMARAVCAALGDSADKIEESYGALVSRHLRDDGTVDVVYQKDRYLYAVTFDRGVSVAEEYSRVDKRDLSEKEIAKFLKMNAGREFASQRSGAALKVKILRAKG